VKDFDVPLMAFGRTLVALELTNCTNFQSGTALHIRKFCPQLKSLVLEIDSAEANSNAGLSEAMMEDNNGERNIWTLEHQVQDLQSKLNSLQVQKVTDCSNTLGFLLLCATPRKMIQEVDTNFPYGNPVCYIKSVVQGNHAGCDGKVRPDGEVGGAYSSQPQHGQPSHHPSFRAEPQVPQLEVQRDARIVRRRLGGS
jgi:hypothetical protein